MSIEDAFDPNGEKRISISKSGKVSDLLSIAKVHQAKVKSVAKTYKARVVTKGGHLEVTLPDGTVKELTIN